MTCHIDYEKGPTSFWSVWWVRPLWDKNTRNPHHVVRSMPETNNRLKASPVYPLTSFKPTISLKMPIKLSPSALLGWSATGYCSGALLQQWSWLGVSIFQDEMLGSSKWFHRFQRKISVYKGLGVQKCPKMLLSTGFNGCVLETLLEHA